MSRSDTLDPEFSPGTYVVDTDSGDPDLALVLSTPGATCIEWDVDRDSPDGRTVADDNPDYSDSESVVVVALVVTGLERRWEDWTDADPSDLSFHKERIPPFTAGVNPTLADQSTDDTLAGYSTVIDTIK